MLQSMPVASRWLARPRYAGTAKPISANAVQTLISAMMFSLAEKWCETQDDPRQDAAATAVGRGHRADADHTAFLGSPVCTA